MRQRARRVHERNVHASGGGVTKVVHVPTIDSADGVTDVTAGVNGLEADRVGHCVQRRALAWWTGVHHLKGRVDDNNNHMHDTTLTTTVAKRKHPFPLTTFANNNDSRSYPRPRDCNRVRARRHDDVVHRNDATCKRELGQRRHGDRGTVAVHGNEVVCRPQAVRHHRRGPGQPSTVYPQRRRQAHRACCTDGRRRHDARESGHTRCLHRQRQRVSTQDHGVCL